MKSIVITGLLIAAALVAGCASFDGHSTNAGAGSSPPMDIVKEMRR
jgi:hypothetical protein